MISYPSELTGERVVLKTLEPNLKNAMAVQQLIKKNAVFLQPFLSWIVSSGENVEQALHSLRRADELRKEDDTALYYIFHQGKMVGAIEALMYPHERELRFWLDNEAKGQGLMRESVMLMEKMLFERNKDRIILGILNTNTASLNLAKRLGYTEDWQGYFEMTYENFKKRRMSCPQKEINYATVTQKHQR